MTPGSNNAVAPHQSVANATSHSATRSQNAPRGGPNVLTPWGAHVPLVTASTGGAAQAASGQSGSHREDDGRVDQAIGLLLRMSLQNTQQTRKLIGADWMTFLIKTESGMVTAITERQKQYQKAVENTRGQHELGPPHLQCFDVVISTLMSCAEVGRERREILSYFYTVGLTQASLEDTELQIRHCQLTKCYDSKLKKLHVKITPWTVTAPGFPNLEDWRIVKAFSTAMREYGTTRKMGSAPPGAMEDAAQTLIERHWTQPPKIEGDRRRRGIAEPED